MEVTIELHTLRVHLRNFDGKEGRLADVFELGLACDSGVRASLHSPTKTTGHCPKICLKGSDETFACNPGQTLLSALNSGVTTKIPSGCRGGGCGVCLVRILSGRSDFGRMSGAHLSPAMREDGWTLACKTFPTTDMVIAFDDQDRA